MKDNKPEKKGDPPFYARLHGLRRRFKLLQWLVPVALMLLVIAYEMGPAHWLDLNLGYPYHLLAELLVFGTVGPLLAYVMLHLLDRWLDERDTSDWQAHLLAEARQEAERGRQLNDDALQVLFSAGMLIDTLTEAATDCSPETAEQIAAAGQALDEAMEHLREHLLNEHESPSS